MISLSSHNMLDPYRVTRLSEQQPHTVLNVEYVSRVRPVRNTIDLQRKRQVVLMLVD